jgi:proteic killer suppression protein
VIRSFADAATEAVWYGRRHRELSPSAQKVALRKLRLLNNARSLVDLQRVPGNRLEALKRDRTGQHSIRLGDGSPWRICFVWLDGGPERVEIVDYHTKEGPQ